MIARIPLFLLLIGGVTVSFEAADALYKEKKYPQALAYYKDLLVSHSAKAVEIRYNIAQCYMQMDSIAAAERFLIQVGESEGDKKLKSIALNYLGFLYIKKEKKKDALAFFRRALKENPQNEEARYNFELLKKQIVEDDDPKEEEPPLPPDEEENNSANDWRKKFNYYLPPDNSEGLPTIHHYDSIPMSKAIELLENMKNEEIKFLQQLRKFSSKSENSTKNQSQW